MTDKFTPKQPTPRRLLLSAIAAAYVRGRVEASRDDVDLQALAREELDSLRLTGIDGLGVEGRESQGGAGLDVDAMAQEIRRVDGKNTLGAAALAEALLPFLASRQQGEAAAWKVSAIDAHGRHYVEGTYYSKGEAEAAQHYLGEYFAGVDLLYTAPPALPAPALPVAQDEEECEDCNGSGTVLEVDEVGQIPFECEKCKGTGGIPAAAPALSEGLTVTDAMIDAALPHVYATNSKVRPIGQFWPGETADESELHNQNSYGRDRVRDAIRAALDSHAPTQPEAQA